MQKQVHASFELKNNNNKNNPVSLVTSEMYFTDLYRATFVTIRRN